jgi:hypothetical protein
MHRGESCLTETSSMHRGESCLAETSSMHRAALAASVTPKAFANSSPGLLQPWELPKTGFSTLKALARLRGS